jgi:hypothetical protein
MKRFLLGVVFLMPVVCWPSLMMMPPPEEPSSSATDWTLETSCMHAAAYTGDGSASETDLSGEGGTLSVSSGDTIPVSSSAPSGFTGNSRDFERDDGDFMSHPDGGATDIYGTEQDITICARTNPESEPANDQWFVAKWDTNGDNRQYGLKTEADNNSFRFMLSSDGITQTIASSPVNTWTTGQWYTVCGVYDASEDEMLVYVNGYLASNGSDNPKAYAGGIYNSSSLYYVGSRNGGNESLDGLYYDDMVLNIALSAAQILEYHQSGIRGDNT